MGTWSCKCGETLSYDESSPAIVLICAKCGHVENIPSPTLDRGPSTEPAVPPASASVRPPDETDPGIPVSGSPGPVLAGADSRPAPLSKDRESRFGSLAVRLGLVRAEDLRRAVDEQFAAEAEGRPVRLGEVLVQRGYMKKEDTLRVLELQEKKVYSCPDCGRRYNVANFEKGGVLKCRFCNTQVSLPDLSGEITADESFYGGGTRTAAPAPAVGLPSELTDLIPGYRIERVLGKGGMGTVYLATQLSLSRPVAIKVLSKALADDPMYISRFLEEARAVGRLQHDNIIRAIDRGQAGSNYYMVIEFAEGETLSERLKRVVRIPEREAIFLARQVAEGLRYAYSLGFIHRDIKPLNLIVSRDGHVKICDLGLTRSIHADAQLAQQGRVICSPLYSPPEIRKGEDTDFRGDIYSLGVTLYEMLTGSPPFTGSDVTALSLQHLSEPPLPPRRVNPALSEGVQRLVLKMLAKDPARRPAGYEELIGEFDALTGAKPPTEQQATKRRKLEKAQRTRRVPIGAITGAGIGLVALVVLVILMSGGKSDGGSAAAGKKKETAAETASTGTSASDTRDKPEDKSPEKIPDRQPDRASDPHIQIDDYRHEINMYLWRLNLSGVAAAYCDRVDKASQAKDLRENMERLEKVLTEFVAGLRERGERPLIGDWIHHADELTFLDQCELAKTSKEAGAKVLGEFVSGVKAGSRARVAVRRGGEVVAFNISFDERPKELDAIAKEAEIIPSGGGETSTKTPIEPVRVTPALRDARERTKEGVRKKLLETWRARRSDFARGVALFLESSESDLDGAAQEILGNHFEKYDPEKELSVEEHAAAARALWEALQPIRGKPAARPLEAIALGHLGEACRDGVTPGKAAAEAMGLSLSGDKKIWGAGEDLALYNLMRAPADAERSAGMSGFRPAYAGAFLLMKSGGIAPKKLYGILVSVSKKKDERARKHVEALAEGLKDAAKCRACTNGKVDCPKCGGTGKVTIPKCVKCGGKGRVDTSVAGSTVNVICPDCQGKEPKKSGGPANCPDQCWRNDHKAKCPTCKGEEWFAQVPSGAKVMTEEPCSVCAATGQRFAGVAKACDHCLGLGVILIPANNPKARLQD